MRTGIADVLIRRLQGGEESPWLVYELCKVYRGHLEFLTSAERYAYLTRLLPGVNPEVIREGLEEFEGVAHRGAEAI